MWAKSAAVLPDFAPQRALPPSPRGAKSLLAPDAAPIDGATHYAIGWGDRGFYLETPTWADLKASTALAAMFWPSGTVVHVTARREPAPSDQATRVVLTGEQYRVLCDAVAESFAGGGAPQPESRPRRANQQTPTSSPFFQPDDGA